MPIEPTNPPAADEVELTLVMPCLDEAKTLGGCIQKALDALRRHQIKGEVVIGDNGSTDGSQEIARQLGARVVAVPVRGYGAALMGGIAAARGKFIIMGDSDDSYDWSGILPFVEKLRAGHDLVMGNRFQGGIRPGAMPALNRYLGNPVLTTLGRLFYRTPAGDFHCGMRGFSKAAAEKMNLQTPPRSRPMAAGVRRTCAAGATAGGICVSCCSTARAGCFCIQECC
jgi:glycosyltransferase involved in cell wall biosynthesis